LQQHRKEEDISVNLSQIIDHDFITPYQLIIIIFVSFPVIVDGFSSQLMGYAVPTLMQEWAVVRNVFIPAVTAGFAGMVFGGIASGFLADRLGRKKMLLINLFIFGTATFITGTANSINEITFYLFVTGPGIGGAMPVCATIVAEFTPSRYRAFFMTGTMVCTPLGGMIAGYITGYLLPRFNWETLFFTGGLRRLSSWLPSGLSFRKHLMTC